MENKHKKIVEVIYNCTYSFYFSLYCITCDFFGKFDSGGETDRSTVSDTTKELMHLVTLVQKM